MPQANQSIFNQRATERLRSPDDLDKYVRVTSPSVWAILGACVALLAGLLAWGVFGTVATSVTTVGAVVDGRATCFLSAEDAAHVGIGDVANVSGQTMEVAYVNVVPVSRDEAAQILGSDYLVAALFDGDWCYQVAFDGLVEPLPEGVPLSVNITTEQVSPISLVLGGDA